MAISGFASLSIKASWDVGPRTITKPNPNPNPNPYPYPNPSLKNNNPKKINLPILQTTSPPTTTTTLKKEIIDTSELLKLNSTNPNEKDEWGLDNEVWLPVPPVVKLPRSMYNAASLAYLGDCVFELYTRRHFLFPPLDIEEYNDRVMAVVRCEAQDALLKKLLNDDYLSEGERDILRWGKNIDSGKTRTTKRAGVAVYNSASSLETLVGYLYLTNVKRLDELMLKVGFFSGASKQPILEETESELHLGYEKWSPVPPKVKKPRPVFKAASLAYLGDCIYELYARRHFLFPPLNIEEYNDRVMAVVCCEAQDALLKKLPNDEFLPQERDILRRGRYINSGKTRTTRRAGVGVYNRASSLEALVGFLYLTNEERLDELMLKMGFSKGTSKQPILEETAETEETEETESKST